MEIVILVMENLYVCAVGEKHQLRRKMEMVDQQKADGRFKISSQTPSGQFWKLTRVETEVDVKYKNPDKKGWQFWKDSYKTRKDKRFAVKAENLGSEIKIDDHVPKQ